MFSLGLLQDFGVGTNRYLHFLASIIETKEPSAKRDVDSPINRSVDTLDLVYQRYKGFSNFFLELPRLFIERLLERFRQSNKFGITSL